MGLHCHGLSSTASDMSAIEGIDSIRSWVSVGLQMHLWVDKMAPKLEVMRITVHWPLNARPLHADKMLLTPFLMEIDIVFNEPGATLHLHGLPHHDIRLLRVVCSRLEIEESLCLWDLLSAVFKSQLPTPHKTTYYLVGYQAVEHVVLYLNDNSGSAILHCQRR